MFYFFYKIPGYSRFDIFNDFDADRHIADGVQGQQYTYSGIKPGVVTHGAEFDLPLIYTSAYQGVTLVECRLEVPGALPTFYEARYFEVGAGPRGYLHCVLAAAQTIEFMRGARWSGAPGRLYNPLLGWYDYPVNIQESASFGSIDYDFSGGGSVVVYATGLFPDGAAPGDETADDPESSTKWFSNLGERTIAEERPAEPWQVRGYLLTLYSRAGDQEPLITLQAKLAHDFPNFGKNITRLQVVPRTFFTTSLSAQGAHYRRVGESGIWGIWYLSDVGQKNIVYNPIRGEQMIGSSHAQSVRVRIGYKDVFELDPREYNTGVYIAARLYRGTDGLSILLTATGTSNFPTSTEWPTAEIPLYELNLSGVAEPLQFTRDYLPSIIQAAAGAGNTIAQAAAGNYVGAAVSGLTTTSTLLGLAGVSGNRQQLGGKPTSADANAQQVNVFYRYHHDDYDKQVGYPGDFRLSGVPNVDNPTPPAGGWWEGGNVKLLWVDQQANLAAPFGVLSNQLSAEYAESRVYCHAKS